MAEEQTEQEKTDIFYVQQQMIDTLTSQFLSQDQEKTVYISPPAPAPRPRNYLLYIAIAIGFLIFTGKIKL